MRVYGIDFTSSPRRSKPITCAACRLEGGFLVFEEMRDFHQFSGFESLLASDGPWIAGIDFPFGQSRRFIETIEWPEDWADYVTHVAAMDRAAFRLALDEYRTSRSKGDKEHRREVDKRAGSISPQKLYGVPVGLMFFEGARRLLECGATVPPVYQGDPQRIVVEAYPGVLARRLIGRKSYKHDTPSKQTESQFVARREVLRKLVNVQAPCEIADDPTGDRLDALLCAVQAAWAWSKRDSNYGIPKDADRREGWIVDEGLSGSQA